jgi:hypothetical protein
MDRNPDETRMAYGDDFGFNEAGVATVLFQSPTANAGQHPGSPGRRWNNSFSKRSPTGKRRRLLPDRKCGHVGCFQFTKIEDGRCLVDDIQDEIQNLSLSNDQSEAEFGTWAAHLASYIGMDEPGQRKTLHRFRGFLRQQKHINVPNQNGGSHPMWRVWYRFTGRKQKSCGPSPKKLKADSVGFQPVCFILAETNVLALRRTRKKDITFFKCSFKLDSEDGLREEKSFKAEYWELKRQLQDRLLELGCSGGLSICGTSSTQVQGR